METKKPVIGVIPTRRSENPEELYIPPKVIAAVEKAGGEVFMIDYDKIKTYEYIGMTVQLDGIIYAGGGDMNPSIYGQEKQPECGPTDRKRDDCEINLFPLILTRGLPLLGICRGMQSINVALGGTLTQHIPAKYEGANHAFHGTDEDFHHTVKIEPGTALYEIVGKTELLTNSYHHQCVDELAPGLIPSAYSKEGFLEAFETPAGGQFIMAVQWHPESTVDLDEASFKIFEYFMTMVRNFMTIPCHHHD